MARLTSTGINFDILNPSDKIESFYWIYPAGTRKLFYQATAPTGWTQVTTHNNKALRVVMVLVVDLVVLLHGHQF